MLVNLLVNPALSFRLILWLVLLATIACQDQM
jgi:hypothetical protein